MFDEEWSFGFCENGSGVFSCPPKTNPMYTYRESVPLGDTEMSVMQVNRILMELSREWPGCSYDLLSRNCNHFCEAFCAKLGVQKLPCKLHLNFVSVCIVLCNCIWSLLTGTVL